MKLIVRLLAASLLAQGILIMVLVKEASIRDFAYSVVREAIREANEYGQDDPDHSIRPDGANSSS